MKRFGGRYAGVTATLALVVALGGGSYAALRAGSTSTKVIHACYAKRGGAMRIVGPRAKCRRSERALAFNQKGRAGAPGTAGAPGATGAQGPTGTPDPSQFYSKAESDARFAHGNATVTTIPQKTVANTQGATLLDLPGFGKLELSYCDPSIPNLRFTNESSQTVSFTFLSAYHGANNVPAEQATLAPNINYVFGHILATDIVQLMVSSPTQVADYEIGLRHDASNNCIVWGHVVFG